jgi:hypothetical protein
MKRIIMLLTLGATLALMLALAGSASAAKPEVVTFHIEETQVVADCGDFEVRTDVVLDIRAIVFFDDEGNADFARSHVQIHDFYYNSDTGEGFAETEVSNSVVDLPSEEEITSVGLRYHVTVPGEGLVLVDVGRLEFDENGEVVFAAGPHQVEEEDFDKLCAALA